MTKQKITESQLKDRIASLEERMSEFGEGFAQSVGQAIGSVAGAPVAAGQWVGKQVGQAYDAAKAGVQDFAKGAQQGYAQVTGGQQPAGAAAGATTKYPTTPQEIKAFQQANGLTADGIIGPKTQAALAKAGLKAPAAPAQKPAAAPAQPAPAQPTSTAPNDVWEGKTSFSQEPTIARIVQLSR